jgi:membrane protein required for colicin V production
VTKFDLIVLALLVISAAVGWARGAVREVAALVALVGAGFLAVFGLPTTAPIVRHVFHTPWIAALVALIAVFVVCYGLLRLIGAGIAQRVQRTHVLGGLDRMAGLAIGAARGLAVLGALYLTFIAATPEDLRPRWITGSVTWPVARAMGDLLAELAPKGMGLAGRLKPAFEHAVGASSGDIRGAGSYDARQRSGSDEVEKSR